MSLDLLTYFNREMAWFKRALTDFAEANPQAGANLRVGENLVEDPHVSRLIESVALLNARIQSRLDDDFPLIMEAFIEHLYPYYLAPKPSMLIVQLEPASDLDGVVKLPAGTMLETLSAKGVSCRFQTCYPTRLTPLVLREARLLSKPFSTPGSDQNIRANGVIELKFEANSAEFSLTETPVDELVLHIRSGELSWRIYDLLYAHCASVVIAASDLDPSPTHLPADQLEAMGFGADESVLPDVEESASVYQHLLEYFAYPEKFLFFRLTGLREALSRCGNSFSVYIYLNETNAELEKTLDRESLSLHCTPAVNLFSTLAEPTRLHAHASEHLVTPDIRAVGDMEVYAIEEVTLLEDGNTEAIAVNPYYSFRHDGGDSAVYWHGQRSAALQQSEGRQGVTDYHLSLSSLDKQPAGLDRHTLQVRCLCSNANLPVSLPFGGGSPRLMPEEPVSGLQGASSLTSPTPVKRVDLNAGLLWRLLSHLNLNYTSLIGSSDSADQLREILRLYDFGDSPITRSLIQSVDSVNTRVTSLPIIVDGRPVVCRGIDFEIKFDVSVLSIGSALLLGETLQRFLSMYVSINSFVRVTARIKGRDGIYHRWEPIVGSRVLL